VVLDPNVHFSLQETVLMVVDDDSDLESVDSLDGFESDDEMAEELDARVVDTAAECHASRRRSKRC